MSSSSRLLANEGSKVELPVFVLPNELLFSPGKRRTLLTVYNPYGSEAQFRIMTTSPDRFDVSSTKGIIKPDRRIDITIRLLGHAVDELPEPTEQPQLVDYFKVTTQVNGHKGNKAIVVYWSSVVSEFVDGDDSVRSQLGEEKGLTNSGKLRLRAHKQPHDSEQTNSSPRFVNQRVTSNSSLSVGRTTRSHNEIHALHSSSNGSNVNLICFLCAIACVVFLYLPLALDSELCKKARITSSTDPSKSESSPSQQASSLLTQISNLLSVSYEMKLGCSFALGLFTYRLISTLPN